MTDTQDMSTTGSGSDRGTADQQTSRLREELGARRAASEIVAEANRMSEQAAAEAESMVAEAEVLATALVEEARQRADATVAQAAAEAARLRRTIDEERDRARQDAAAEVRAELAALRSRVEKLLVEIGGGLGDLSTLLSVPLPTGRPVRTSAEEPGPEAESVPELRVRDSLYAVASLSAQDEVDADTDPSTGSGAEPEAGAATEPAREPGAEPVAEPEPAESDPGDDLEDAGNDPRPLGWLFRGH